MTGGEATVLKSWEIWSHRFVASTPISIVSEGLSHIYRLNWSIKKLFELDITNWKNFPMGKEIIIIIWLILHASIC